MANRNGKRAGAKLSIVLLSVFLFLLLLSPVAFAAIYGDINDDGDVDVQDVVLAMKHALGLELLTGTEKSVADVNGDGDVDVQDVTLIMQYSLGLIDEFPFSELKVSGLKVINAKIIGVEFNRTPSAAEVASVKFKVTSFPSNAVVTTVGTWDGSTAKLSRAGNLDYTPGTYVVEVTGVTTPFSGTITIATPTATSLEIRTISIPDATVRAPLRVTLLDQYGAEMTLHPGQFTWTAINLRSSVNVTNRISYDSVAKFVINTDTVLPGVFELEDEIQITFVHTSSNLSKTVILPVTYKTQLSSITFGNVILPTGATEVTTGFMNVRIPVTAKDQYGNDMFLVNGANVNLLSSDQLIVKDGDLSFVTVGGKQHVNISSFQSKGTVTILIMGTPGVVGSKAITVVEAVPYELKVVTTPDSSIVEGKSTVVRFSIHDQFGTVITSDQHPYEVKVIKSSGLNARITSPTNLAVYTISEASANINITAGALPPLQLSATETVTFRLQKADSTFIDSEVFSFNIIAAPNDLDISVNKTQYVAGENIEVTVKALLGGVVHTLYDNVSGPAKITLFDGTEDKFYNRTLTFINGVATTTVPATLAYDGFDLIVEYDGMTETEVALFNVKVGPASKFILSGNTGSPNLGIRLTDAHNNNIPTFTGGKLVRITTYPNAATPPALLSAEGDITINFTAGVGTIVFDGNLVPGTYTVTHGGNTGTLIIPTP